MKNPGGYLVITDPEVSCPIEVDTFTCKHCNVVVPVPPKSTPGGMCLKCSGLICDKCVDRDQCLPFEKILDEMERKITRTLERDRYLRSIGL